MRYLICGLLFLMPIMPARATLIDFAPGFGIASLDSGQPCTIENFTIVSRSSSTTASGSGSAVATIDDWDRAAIRVALGTDPGEARASLVNIATFDLLFEEPDEVGLEAGFGINGPLETDPGDSSFANWDISIEIDSLLLQEDQQHVCTNGVPIIGSCVNFFDDSFGQFPFTPGDDLRLSVTTSMRFDLGVSRAAEITEPSALAIMLVGLAWIGRRLIISRRS